MRKVTPEEVLDLIKRLPDTDKHMFIDRGYWVTTEWLMGSFAGRSFVERSYEKACQEMIDYFYNHIGHDSMVGDAIAQSGFPDLDRVYEYCKPKAE